jgi:GNAT superfamily N-acetyltransferase
MEKAVSHCLGIRAIISNSWRIIESVINLELLNAHETRPLFGELVDIYQAVFSQTPFYETLPDFLNFTGRISYHAHQSGFRCVVARAEKDPAVIGFVYGYAGQAGSWYYEQAAQRLNGDQMREYLGDYFEFAEMALLPAWQGQGLGGRLHDAILEGLDQHSACLATPEVETRALQLYRARGWVRLAGGITLPGTVLKYQMMAKILS